MPPLRPQPRFPEVDSESFWEATKRHELTYQTCNKCSEVIFYPRRHCTSCGADDTSWHVSSSQGSVYTFAVIMQSRHPSLQGPGSLRCRLRGPGRGFPHHDQYRRSPGPHQGYSVRNAGQGPVGGPGRGGSLPSHVRARLTRLSPKLPWTTPTPIHQHTDAGGKTWLEYLMPRETWYPRSFAALLMS